MKIYRKYFRQEIAQQSCDQPPATSQYNEVSLRREAYGGPQFGLSDGR